MKKQKKQEKFYNKYNLPRHYYSKAYENLFFKHWYRRYCCLAASIGETAKETSEARVN